MATLIDVRNLLALRGRMEAQQLSAELHISRAMVDAMLERLEAMGKAQCIRQQATGCLTGSCKQCPEGKAACTHEFWSLRAG